MTTAIPDNLQKANRFSNYVPKPETRFNLGKPDTKNTFGYPGASLTTKEHLYVDVGKITQLQSGSHVRLQAKGYWEQYATGNLVLATTATATIAAKVKMIISCSPGTGRGSTPVANYSPNEPAWLDYQNLLIHYNVDGLASALKTMFYGSAWKKLQRKSASDQKDWFLTAPKAADEPAGGLIRDSVDLLQGLGFRAKDVEVERRRMAEGVEVVENETIKGEVESFLQGMRWKPNFITAHLSPLKWTTSEYPVSIPLDPFAPTSFYGKGFFLTLNKAQAWLTQIGVYLKRMAEAMQMVLGQLDNFILLDKARSFIGAVKSLYDVVEVNRTDWSNQIGRTWNADNFKPMPDAKLFWNKAYWVSPSADPKNEPQPATLLGGAEPYLLSPQLGATVPFVAEKGGAVVGTADFSDRLLPATLVLTVSGLVTAVEAVPVLLAPPAALVLDGATASYDAAQDRWVLPAGFSQQAGVITKGGALFTVSASPGITLVDRTLQGAKAMLDVDGRYEGVDLTRVNAPGAEARAAELARLLGGKLGCTASASGAKLTLTGVVRGAAGSVSLAAATLPAALGLAGTGVAPSVELDAETVQTRLQAAVGPRAKVVLEGTAPARTLKVTSTATGATAYLEFKGPLAATLFGSDPATASGTAAPDGGTMASKRLAYLENSTRFFAPFQAAAQPLFEATDRLIEVWDTIDKQLKTMQKALLGASSIPSIGMIAGKGGLALASLGEIGAVGHSITLFAVGKPGIPDEEKQTLFEVLTSRLIFTYNKKLEDFLEVDAAKRPSFEKVGHIAALSSGRVNLVASDTMTLMSLKSDVYLVGRTLHLDAKNDVVLAAHAATTRVRGKALELGDLDGAKDAQNKKTQAPTETVSVGASKSLTFAALKGNDPKKRSGLKLRLGSGTNGFATLKSEVDGKVDSSNVGFVFDLKAKRATLGANKSRAQIDVVAGTASFEAEKEVVLTAGNKAVVSVKNDGATIHGKVDIGGVLTVQGSAIPSAQQLKPAAKLNPSFGSSRLSRR
ncbi:MAG: hypothetical protein FJ095_15240 [Deltaproteobacteria bacterium]|nr:hypothetical protein [Deltaproteobacteria bacterium]